MKLASSDARNTTALAISSGLPSRPIGTAVDSAFSRCCPVSDEARDPESAPARWIAKQNASLVRGNVTSRQGLEQAVTGTDVLVHNAGVYEFGADSDAAKRMQR